jgi:hypothetical protein
MSQVNNNIRMCWPHGLHNKLQRVEFRGLGGHRSDYPVLPKMAFDILSIPSMSPELERAFSQAKKLITGERNRLGGETVTACECQKQWQV